MEGEIDLATSPDPGRRSAQPQTTAIAALGALTEELVAARETMAHLPSREEVDLRINHEREDRKRGQRLVGAVIALLVLVAGIQAWIVEETKDVAGDTKHIATDTRNLARDIKDLSEVNKNINAANLELVSKIDCVVRVAATIPPGPEQQAAYGACIQLASEEVERRTNGKR